MIAGRLTMRAAIERNTATGLDNWGNPVAPAFASTGEPVPCFMWSEQASQQIDGEKSAEIEMFKAQFALAADVRTGDVVASVTNRLGVEIIPGRLAIEGPVQNKHTHREANLRRIG